VGRVEPKVVLIGNGAIGVDAVAASGLGSEIGFEETAGVTD
jgi:hypothetical protein